MSNIKANTRPIEPVNLEFQDRVIAMKFNNYAMSILDTEFEGSLKIAMNIIQKPYDSASKFLYAGIRGNKDDNFTFDEAKSLIVNLDYETIMQINNEAVKCFSGGKTSENTKKKFLNKDTQKHVELLMKILNQ